MTRRRRRRQGAPQRTGRYTAAEDAERATRRERVLELRAKGWTFDAIATEVGLNSRQAAHEDYRAALRTARAEHLPNLEDARAFDLERLERLARKAWEHIDAGDLKGIDSMLRIMDRRARLLGLDQPVKHEISWEALDREIARLEQRLADAETQTGDADDDDGLDGDSNVGDGLDD